MIKLWNYEDYLRHLNHENALVRHWAFKALGSRFFNKYTDQVADLISDANDLLVCAVLGYLADHKAVQHAPAILERFKGAQGLVSSNCALSLGKMNYAPAMAVMLKSFGATDDPKALFGIIEYLGRVRTEESRRALQGAAIQLKHGDMMRSAVVNLLRHYHPEDINLIVEGFFNSDGKYSRYDFPTREILFPLGGDRYFADLTEAGENDILSTPSETIEDMLNFNAHISIDGAFKAKLIALLENRLYQDFATALLIDARTIIDTRYDEKGIPGYLRECSDQDMMCLHLIEEISKRSPIFTQLEGSNTIGSDLIACIISAYFAIKERSAYIEALNPGAGDTALLQALKNSGPNLPVPIQEKIKQLSPISALKASLSEDLSAWSDNWIVKLMGMIGSKEFAPDLIRVLRIADALDFIHGDAIDAITTLGESADEIFYTAVKSRELDDWDSFTILEHLPYTEAYELAVQIWENPGEDPMNSYEGFSSCLNAIGERRGINILQDIYNNTNEADFVGDDLGCLSRIHRVDIPELPSIIKRRKARVEAENTRVGELNELFETYSDDETRYEIENDPAIGTYKRKTAKIGRNEPCPCGSGKKYKKCCLNKS